MYSLQAFWYNSAVCDDCDGAVTSFPLSLQRARSEGSGSTVLLETFLVGVDVGARDLV